MRSACFEAYQTNTRSKNVRESRQNVDRRIKPFRPSFIGTPDLIWALDLLLKNRKKGGGRVAVL